jgi:UDP-N-acetylmuramate dehydrogenase
MLPAVKIPENVQTDYPLARLTTVRAGGPADLFARPMTEDDLVELLRWAAENDVAPGVVGSGSNLLVSDEGFRGLVMKLDGTLSEIERDGAEFACLRPRRGSPAGGSPGSSSGSTSRARSAEP